MGFLAPAIPWIVKGGSLLGGWLAGRHAQNAALQRSPEEQTALTGAQTAASGLNTTGTQLNTQGAGATQQSLGYYEKLLGGNRATMAEATAAPRAAITDEYRGATRNLEHSGIQGAGRDLATAELNRDRVGKIAGLTTGQQGGAASAISDIGTNLISQGGARMGAAGSLYGNLLGQGQTNRTNAQQTGAQTGSSIGSFLFDILSGLGGGKAKMPGSTMGLPPFGGNSGFPGLPGGSSGPF